MTKTLTLLILFFALGQPSNKSIQDDSLMINGTRGLLILVDYTSGILTINNPDNSVFKSFDFSQPESSDYYNILDSVIADFNLFAYKPDYGLLMFESNVDSENYIIKTKSGDQKQIPKSIENFKFYTWSEFLLSKNYLSILGYYPASGDLIKFYSNPDEISDYVQFKQTNELFLIKAIEVKNDWIKIKRESIDSDTIKPNIGWTKWFKDDKLIIDFSFLL